MGITFPRNSSPSHPFPVRPAASLKDVKTRNFVPVDLNSLLYLNARLLSEFHKQLGNDAQADTYREQAESLRNNIQNVLWDQEAGSWFDYDTKNMVGVYCTQVYGKQDYFYGKRMERTYLQRLAWYFRFLLYIIKHLICFQIDKIIVVLPY